MCGISGILHGDGKPISGEVLTAMTDVIRHRGPDDGGVWMEDGGDVSVGFGSRRLSILDLSPRGHMPMHSEDGRYSIVYNGEVYNFREIRRSLEERHHRFTSDTDTEVILRAYMEWGREALHRFNGMFAIAIWDRKEKRLFLARDRMGKKPLYYAVWGSTFLFASEIKSLRCYPGLPLDIDRDAIHLYLHFRIIPHPHTIFRAVRKLPQGHTLEWNAGECRIEPYWDVLDDRLERPLSLGGHETRISFYHLVEDAVEKRLVSDVPLGALLSGGLDSTIITSLMARLVGRPINTFTLGIEREDGASVAYDESAIARKTAKLLGTDHHELILTPSETRDVIPDVLSHCDEPFATSSAIPTFLVSRLAREDVTVVLSGDGPDEILGGYRAYLMETFVRYYSLLPEPFRVEALEPLLTLMNAHDETALGRLVRRTQRVMRSMGPTPEDRFFSLTNKFNDVSLTELIRPEWRPSNPDLAMNLFRGYYSRMEDGRDLVNPMLYVDTKLKLTDHILTKVDLMSMKVSLEVRAPFLDHRVVSFAFSLPGDQKVRNFRKKHFLRNVFRSIIPPHVLHLPKRGFEIPVGAWFKGPLKNLFLDTMEPPKGGGLLRDDVVRKMYREHCENRSDHGEKLWILFALRFWARNNGVDL